MNNKKISNYLVGLSTLALCLFSFNKIQAQEAISVTPSPRWEAGNVIHYENNWVEIIPGDIPLVISAPHGGFMKPESIPDRDCKGKGKGRMVTVADSRTIPTARAIGDAFYEKYHKRPFIILSNIARTKVDQNRGIKLAACGDPEAEQAWYDFHKGIDTALSIAVEKFGYALYIDLHGHGHKNKRLELGYGLNGVQLREAYQEKGQLEEVGKRSSLQNYLKKKDASFWEMLWGKDSFGSLIYEEGIPASPSMQDHYPFRGEKFFSGGYNTRRYTSAKYPHVFGWQIESNYKGVRDTKAHRAAFGKAFVAAYTKYIKKYNLSGE